jgi:hypothetical protein
MPLARPGRAARIRLKLARQRNPSERIEDRHVTGKAVSLRTRDLGGVTTVSFSGSGRFGSAIAQLAADAGYDALLSPHAGHTQRSCGGWRPRGDRRDHQSLSATVSKRSTSRRGSCYRSRDLSSRSGTRTRRPWQALEVPPARSASSHLVERAKLSVDLISRRRYRARVGAGNRGCGDRV